MSESTIDFPLPPEILYGILLLLPFESILACKRVSKICKNLVNDPEFSKRYHHRGSLILTIVENNLYCVLFRRNNVTRFPSHTVHRLPITLAVHPTAYHEVLSGPSNGIACVKAANGYFHLINLFTGVSHTVKDAPQRLNSRFWIRYGFGYDHHDDDYKIMVVCNYNNRAYLAALISEDYDKFQNKENTLFWVYSSKTGTWKKYDGFPCNTLYSLTWSAGSCFYNGVLHSLVHTNEFIDDAQKPVILTFDLHTCSFGEISVPDDYNVNLHSWMFVTEFDGRLCCIYSYWSSNERVMELYGGGGRWKKWESVIDSSLNPRDVVSNWWLLRADLYDGGKVVLLVFRDRFLWCDLVSREVEVVCMTSAWLRKEETKEREVEAMIRSLSQFYL